MIDAVLWKLKYPIGEYQAPLNINRSQIEQWIAVIAQFPAQINTLTSELTKLQLNWPYRPGGWTIKQVVHHCADSHMNSIIRFKLALTEDLPDIRPYHEDRWAQLNDSLDTDISDAIILLTGLHGKWVKLLGALDEDQLKRRYRHPENGRTFTLNETIGNYAWHCEHHSAHIAQAIAHQGLFT